MLRAGSFVRFALQVISGPGPALPARRAGAFSSQTCDGPAEPFYFKRLGSRGNKDALYISGRSWSGRVAISISADSYIIRADWCEGQIIRCHAIGLPLTTITEARGVLRLRRRLRLRY